MQSNSLTMLRARKGRGGAPSRDVSHLCTCRLPVWSLLLPTGLLLGGLESKPPRGAESCTHCCRWMRPMGRHSEEVEDGFSVPWVSPVLLVVVL